MKIEKAYIAKGYLFESASNMSKIRPSFRVEYFMSGGDKGNWGNEIASKNKWTEEVCKTSAGNYRLLFENANEAIVVLQDGMIKFLNPQFVKISGY